MEEHPELPEPVVVDNQSEVAPRIRGLRILARIIARHLINSQRDTNKNNSTAGNEQRSRLTHDKDLS
jgi:hypothetical protein